MIVDLQHELLLLSPKEFKNVVRELTSRDLALDFISQYFKIFLLDQLLNPLAVLAHHLSIGVLLKGMTIEVRPSFKLFRAQLTSVDTFVLDDDSVSCTQSASG